MSTSLFPMSEYEIARHRRICARDLTPRRTRMHRSRSVITRLNVGVKIAIRWSVYCVNPDANFFLPFFYLYCLCDSFDCSVC
ncbi:unnamed protein product [Linum tenue]|uniref:Uncharacterized protein n=1 Tax=Linum tenue TaxID=586396 RepID=A0AAV0PVL8_9ROSI|nr:unnamed protein product [Linum tenue]